jgi:hypothetical protein
MDADANGNHSQSHGVDFGQSREQWFIMLTFFLAQMKVVALETRF